MPSELHEAFPRLASDLRRVREEMRSAVTDEDRRVRKRLEHFLTHTGRLFRPSLTLIAAYVIADRVTAPAPADSVTAATAIEFLHVATLYHDDVMDEADTRRGVPTVNSRFGNSTAILSGDHLLACCMQLASRLGTQATETIADTLRTMCAGQIIETADLFATDRTEDAYFTAINGKTASLLSASAVLGAQTAGAPAHAFEALGRFAHDLGMAFQIWDDIRDIQAPETAIGKGPGTDLRNGVYTLPVIYGMRAEPDKLAPLLEDPRLAPPTVSRIKSLLERSGAINEAVRVAEEHVRRAFTAVTGLRREYSAAVGGDRFAVIARTMIPEFDRLHAGDLVLAPS